MSRRALEVGAALAAAHAKGHGLVFATFTMRHRKGQGLIALWDGLQAAWRRVTTGKGWTTDKGRYGVVGWVRVVEVTTGKNGWHVHVHAVLILDGKVTDTSAAALHASMFGRWSAGLTSAGFAAPLMVGQDARVVRDGAVTELADYFSKAVDLPGAGSAPGATAGGPGRTSAPAVLGLELTGSQTKTARKAHGTVPPWRLLDSVIEDGDADALDSWHEWERGSKGRRQISWSQGLRALLGVGVEKSDDDIAGEELGGTDLLLITADGWRAMVRSFWLIPQLLTVTESGGLHAARDFLQAHGIDYMEA